MMKKIFPLLCQIILLAACLLEAYGRPDARLKSAAGSVSPKAGSQDIFSPDVIISSPEEREVTVEESSLTVKALARSYKTPLDSVTVTLNGEQVLTETYTDMPRTKTELEIPLKLKPGENSLIIIARNRGGAASQPATRKIIYAPRAAAAKTSLFVLAIGISKYKEIAPILNFPHRDAQEIARAFSTQEGRLFERVESRLLLNEQATREAILHGLSWLNDSAKNRGGVRMLLLFGYSKRSGYEEAYFLTSDYDPAVDIMLSNLRFSQFWESLSAVPGPAVIFADTPYTDLSSGNPPVISESKLSNLSDTISFFSSKENQVSVENAQWGHGAFAKALLEGLSDKADVTKDSCVDTDELNGWLRNRVFLLTDRRQQPYFIAGANYRATTIFCYK